MEPCIARARNRAFGSSPRKPAFPGSATGILPVQGDERYRSCSGMAKMAMAQRGARRIGRATGPERFGTPYGHAMACPYITPVYHQVYTPGELQSATASRVKETVEVAVWGSFPADVLGSKCGSTIRMEVARTAIRRSALPGLMVNRHGTGVYSLEF